MHLALLSADQVKTCYWLRGSDLYVECVRTCFFRSQVITWLLHLLYFRIGQCVLI